LVELRHTDHRLSSCKDAAEMRFVGSCYFDIWVGLNDVLFSIMSYYLAEPLAFLRAQFQASSCVEDVVYQFWVHALFFTEMVDGVLDLQRQALLA